MSAGRWDRSREEDADGSYRPRRMPILQAALGLMILSLLGAAAFPRPAAAVECTTTWVGSTGGAWHTAGNWSTGKAPTSEDVACIGAKTVNVTTGTNRAAEVHSEGALNLSGGSLELASGTSTVPTFTQTGGILTGAGTLEVATWLTWFGGDMEGAGATVLKAGASGEFPAGQRVLKQRSLVNHGSFTIAPKTRLETKDGAEILNTGTFVVNSEWQPAISNGGGAGPEFVNSGTVEKSSGAAATEIAINFANEGLVRASTGNLSFKGGGTSGPAGEWRGEEGTSVRFVAGAFALTESTWRNTIVVDGGSVVAEDVDAEEGLPKISSGTLTVKGTLETPAFTQVGGVLTGAGTLEIEQSLAWSGGNMTGTGSTVLEPGGAGTITGGSLQLIGRSLSNQGTLTVPAASRLIESEGALVTNTGTFIVNSEWQPAVAVSGTIPSKFVNAGVLKKTTGVGMSEIRVPFENQSEVTAESGYLSFAGGGTSNGVMAASPGSSIRYLGGSFTFPGGSWVGATWIGSTAAVTTEGVEASAATLNLSASLTVKGALTTESLALSSGLLTGPGSLEISKTMAWTGGTMEGSGSTVVKAGATGEIPGGQRVLKGRALINHGSFALASASRLETKDGARIRNTGTFVANSEWEPAISIGPFSLPTRFVNQGTLRKTAGTGTTWIDLEFENYGRLEGKLKISNPVSAGPSEQFGKRSYCADPVECATGNLLESQTDLAIGGRGIGLRLTRSYSAQAAAAASSPGAFGYGWSSSYSSRLVIEGAGERVTLFKDDGSTVPFQRTGESTYSGPGWSQELLSGSPETGYTRITPDQTQWVYSGAGRVEGIVDRNGNETTLAYDEAGRLKDVEDPGGRDISFAYNLGGQVQSVEDPMGHLIEYTYEAGHLVKVTMPGEVSPRWQFKYDASHRMTTMTDGRGGKTTNEYDASNRVKLQIDPAGRTYKFDYASFHTRVTNQATGAVTDQWFTSNNQPYSVTYAFGTASARTETFEYDEGGRLVTRTDPAGRATTYTYNAAGDRTSVKDPAGNETKWTYSGTHDVLTATAPGGLTTTIVRDAAGNPETISRPAPGGGTQTTSFEYDENGQLESFTDPLERTWDFEYNANGDLIAETNPEGESQIWTYDENSQVTAIVSPRGNEEGAEPAEFTTTVNRDAQGRPVKVTDPLGHAVEYGYDGNGNVEEKTDPEGHTTTYFYNAVDEPTKTEKPNGDTTKAAYDGEGQVVSQTNGNEDTTIYVRNLLGQVTEVVDPLERKRKYKYDLAGNLETVVDQAGRETTYTYDNADRVTGIEYSSSGTPDVSFEYDADGHLTEMVDGSGESSFVYDVLGRLVEAEDGHGDIVEYDYNLADEQTGITYPNGKSVSRTFDGAGRMTSVSDWLGGITTFAYDADSNLEEILFPAGTGRADQFGYDATGMVSDVTFEDDGEPLATIDYSRDKAAQIEAIVTEGLPGLAEQEFGYDENGRLVESSAGSYEYDAAGYLLKTPTATNSFNAAGELEASGGVTYDYNAMGERTEAAPESGPATAYDYDQAGGLTSVQRSAEGEAPALSEVFAYDGTRLATSHTVGETTRYLTWDTSGGPPLLLADDSRSYIYGPGGLPIAQIDSEEAPTYYHHDQLGSIRMLSNATGESVAAFSFEPYGAPEASSGAAQTPFGFAGQFTTTGSGFQYLRARFYDPATGQFLTEDPLAAITGEPYGYGAGNPLSYVDRTGLGPCVLGFIACDEDDDPCDSLATGPMLPACLIPQEAAPTVTNVSAGAGDSLLSLVPGTDPGPWLRDQLGINNVSECSAAYRFSKGFVDWVSMTKGIASGAEYAGRHYPDIVKAGRDMSRRQNERTVHLPPEIMP